MILYTQYKSLPESYVREKIKEFLREDIPNTDITSDLSINPEENTIADIQAEESLVFIGEHVLPYFFDKNFEFELFYSDGEFVNRGEIIGTIKGKTKDILAIERTMLNILQRLCGIANNVRKYTNLASPFRIKILDSRKTIPGLRLFDKYAVAAAGGYNHRLDLSSGILIKDNHIANKDLLATLISIKEKNTENFPIELEVDNLEQLKIGLEADIDGFLLDNFTPEDVQKAVSLIRSSRNGDSIFIEVSGGINLNNIEPYLPTGINAISIGALTHTVKAANIHLEFRTI